MTVFWVLLLYLGGLFLIVAEAFLPGGILGVFGWLLVVASAAYGVYYYPGQALFIIIAEGVGAVGALILTFFILSKTNAARFLSLPASLDEADGFTNQMSEKELVGRTGVVFTPLRPAGTILLGNRRIDAVSEGLLIEKDEAVRIIEVHGNRVVVERTDAPEPAAPHDDRLSGPSGGPSPV